jgi:methyl acetate hydrolase
MFRTDEALFIMEMSRRTILRGSGFLAAASAASVEFSHAVAAEEQAPERSRKFEPIDGVMRKAVEVGSVAGVVAVAASAEGIICEGAFGKADVRTGSPMTIDTVFWLLSMTKALTATACMQLVEQGRLDLNQEAAKILPQLASPKVLEGFDEQGQPRLRPAKRPLTVRHLITHTSGYTYSVWSEALTRYESMTGMPDIATCQNAAFEAPLEFDPGEQWRYGIGMDGWAS